MLTVKNLTKKFDTVTAVDNISFTLKKGEILGFLGTNGAGKTTSMRLITGFLTPTSGKITINGKEPKKVRDIIGYLPEDNPLYHKYTAWEYLNFIGRMFNLDPQTLKKNINQVVADCDLAGVLAQSIETLSRGFKQRVGLAATLVHQPSLIIMDEPTTGLDPNQQKEIRKLIKTIAKNKGVILSTHYLTEAQEVCDRIIIIHQGKIIADKKTADLKKKRQSLENLFTKLTLS